MQLCSCGHAHSTDSFNSAALVARCNSPPLQAVEAAVAVAGGSAFCQANMSSLRALARLRPASASLLRVAYRTACPELHLARTSWVTASPLPAAACSAHAANVNSQAQPPLWLLPQLRSFTTTSSNSSSSASYSKDELARQLKTTDLAHLLHDAGIDFRDCLERCGALQ